MRTSISGILFQLPASKLSMDSASSSVSKRTGTSNSKSAVITSPLAGAVLKVTIPVVVLIVTPLV
jgi:hypothetical protein